MRERHFGEAQQVVGPFHNRWIEPERAADDELDMACAVQPETVDFPRMKYETASRMPEVDK